MQPRSQRDHLEALQGRLRELELRRIAVRAQLSAARALAAEAERREREAALAARPPLLPRGAMKHIAGDVARWGVISLVVVAVFAAVIGTVTVAIEHYRAEIRKQLPRE